MKIALGDKVRDTITGCEGIAMSRTECLEGCVHYDVQPQMMVDGRPVTSCEFNEHRLERVGVR